MDGGGGWTTTAEVGCLTTTALEVVTVVVGWLTLLWINPKSIKAKIAKMKTFVLSIYIYPLLKKVEQKYNYISTFKKVDI